MKNYILLLGVILLSNCKKDENHNIVKEQWSYTFGGVNDDIGYSVKQTIDGGYIFVGITQSLGNGSSGYSDIYLVKISSNGIEQWSKTFGDLLISDQGNCIQLTSDGGYIITGSKSNNEDHYNIISYKINENGLEEWSKSYGGTSSEYGNYIEQTNDGGFIMVGSSYSYGNGLSDVYLIKTDENGVELWSKTYGGEGYDFGGSIQQTNDGGYIIIGSTTSYGNGENNIYLIKTDINGEEQWIQTHEGSISFDGHPIQQTTDGGYVYTGYLGDLFSGSNSLCLNKINENGLEEWSQTFGETGLGCSVEKTNDGGYVIVGYTTSFDDGDVYLIKTNENGEEVWSQTFGGTEGDMGISIQQTNDGGYIIVGSSKSFGNGSGDVYLIKTDENGNCENL